MGGPARHAVALSPGRRYVADLVRAGMSIPLVTVQKDMNVADLMEARARAVPRPSWVALFTKAYAKVVARRPELRRVFLEFPWERMVEMDSTAADICIETLVRGEPTLAFVPIPEPDKTPLAEIDRLVAEGHADPLAKLDRLKPALRLARFPRFVRRFVWWALLNVSAHVRAQWFGVFGVTSVGNWGVDSVRPIAPAISILHYGAIDPAGNVAVRLTYDHRVLDGSVPSLALNDLETLLATDLLHELRGLAEAPATASA